MNNHLARIVRGFCVGYMAGRLWNEAGAIALVLGAVWVLASLAVDLTEEHRVTR